MNSRALPTAVVVGLLALLAQSVGARDGAQPPEQDCDDRLRALVEELQSRPWVGLAYHYVENEGNSFLVSRVQQEGPAAEAGLRRGDVIVQIGDRQISGLPSYEEGRTAFRSAFGGMEIGVPLRLEVERDGERFRTDLIPAVPEDHALAELVGRRLLTERLGLVISAERHGESRHTERPPQPPPP